MHVEFAATPYPWEARTQLWVFVDLPAPLAADIAEIPRPRAGFGAVRVEARIGLTVWRTSIFPGGQGGGASSDGDPAPEPGYILPLKKAVRVAEGVELGREVTIGLTVLDL
ncbi:DUF1905 domain-containing protein [Leucobacter luti]|uniref:Uncharacterized protein DUF1905 n=1 Tax=Leucobacter luti TaxID=340320 RepID=A0A4Q7TIZ2_9MICO|nr:DUF1905 domain-containing protein [Leucobacter luti]MBL3699672.1 DUF1905 domain-containing protein [Leucobacter luti]RZT59448.1 uncharacterized protein DUF1905 [Leucobacter luti]